MVVTAVNTVVALEGVLSVFLDMVTRKAEVLTILQ